MGVLGLWRLIDATGKPVPVESLEGKVLAVDVSIWIHQVLQGYQDRRGNPMPNAHLLGLFNRICKLLYYKIKPVFVFDGGVPMLKKNTIAARRKQKSIANSKVQKMRNDLMSNLMKHTAVKSVLNNRNPENKDIDDASQKTLQTQKSRTVQNMFMLPDMPSTSAIDDYITPDEFDSDSSVDTSPRKQTKWKGNIHHVDVSTGEFKSLPADVRYDILTDLKETRKQNSWGRLHEMPKDSHEFSGYQMKRLLKRRLVQESLESAEKEMGGKTLTLDELNKLLTEQGVNTKDDDVYRIAADSTTRLIYINDKNSLTQNTREETNKESPSKCVHDQNQTVRKAECTLDTNSDVPIIDRIEEYEFSDELSDFTDHKSSSAKKIKLDDLEYDSDITCISESEANRSQQTSKKFGKTIMNPAITYMLEYSGLSQQQIVGLMKYNKKKNANKTQKKGMLKLEQSKNTKRVVSKHFLKKDDPEDSDDLVEVGPVLNQKEDDKSLFFPSKDVNIEKKENSLQNSPQNKVITTDTDTDSSDFIEIKNVPIPEPIIKKPNESKSFEITIKPDDQMEDDLFSDVFRDKLNDSNISLDCQNQSNEVLESSKSDIDNDIDTSYIHQKFPNSENSQSNEIDSEIVHKDISSTPEKSDQKDDVNECKNNVEEIEQIDVQIDDKIITREDQHTTVHQLDRPNSREIREHESPGKLDPKPTILPVDEEELRSLKTKLEDAHEELIGNIGKLERQATDITDQIRLEAQELLRLFGIPYLIAPMEAEAQCAYLEQIKLTDGTITDDSDIWLFGGQCVYKNFFNNNKQVLQFRSDDIEHHFKLARKQMIQLALLVGSDYTSGLAGVGPVTALEIIAAFPSEGDDLLKGLTSFSAWFKTGRVVGPGKASLRNKLKNLKIEKGFPSQAVVQAYLFPTIDESKDTFTWGKIKMILLNDYVKQKFGWTKTKFEDTMGPVLKKINEVKSQKGIESYFKVQSIPRSIEAKLSQRVQKAVQRLNNQGESGDEQLNNVESTKKPKKQRTKKITNKIATIQENEETDEVPMEQGLEGNDSKPSEFAVKKQPLVVSEFIPQREHDKLNALKNKLHAIEVFRKSRKGLSKTTKFKRAVRRIKKEAELSESSSDSSS